MPKMVKMTKMAKMAKMVKMVKMVKIVKMAKTFKKSIVLRIADSYCTDTQTRAVRIGDRRLRHVLSPGNDFALRHRQSQPFQLHRVSEHSTTVPSNLCPQSRKVFQPCTDIVRIARFEPKTGEPE